MNYSTCFVRSILVPGTTLAPTILSMCLLVMGSVAVDAHAEIKNCKGLWTNVACETEPENRFEEVVRPPVAATAQTAEQPVAVGTSTPLSVATPHQPECPANKSWTRERPAPVLSHVTSSDHLRRFREERVHIKGSVQGYGQVTLTVSLTERIGSQNLRRETAWAKTIFFADDPGQELFTAEINLPADSSWNIEVENVGTFRGYCREKDSR